MPADRPLLIVNPRSGAGLSEASWARMAGAIAQGLGPFDTRMTERPGHARHIAEEEARAGRALVVAVGGDGTLNEVVNGLMAVEAREGTQLGLIPRGTGGDFRRTIDGPQDMAGAAKRIAEAKGVKVDVGRVAYVNHDGQPAHCHFINVSSFGFSAAVAEKANRSSKKLGPKAAFLGATVKTLLGHDNAEVQVSVDDEPPLRRTVMLGAIGNGKYFGGGMKICPEATLNSGKLNVVLVGDLGVAEVATKIHRLYAGTHLSIDRVEARSAQQVSVAPVDEEVQVLLEVDGETPGRLPARWEILPGALTMRI